MIEQKNVTVNGEEYLITQFGARKGWKLGRKVAKVMLPVISKFYSEEGGSFGDMMEAVAENIDQLDDQTIDELLSNVSYKKQQIDIDNHFAGNYGSMLLLIWEVIMYNFQDVFTMATEGINE